MDDNDNTTQWYPPENAKQGKIIHFSYYGQNNMKYILAEYIKINDRNNN